MSARKGSDALATRVERVVDLVTELRQEVRDLQARLDHSEEQRRSLQAERGGIRQRVMGMLEQIGG